MDCRKLDYSYVVRFGFCPTCGVEHWYTTQKRTLGKIDAYSTKWKAKKDDMRHRHHNDLLQPIVNGRENYEFTKVYGKPKIKGL